MKRNGIILAGLLAVASLIVMYSVLARGKSSADARRDGPESPETVPATNTSPMNGSAQVGSDVRGLSDVPESESLDTPEIDSSETVRLSLQEQRPGEMVAIHEGRVRVLSAYEDFRRSAGMTARQERELLRILADAQHQWAQLEVYHDSLRDPSLMRDEVERNPVKALNAEIEVPLREVLTDEQFAAFRRHIGGAYQFSSFAPLDVPLPPELSHYGEIRE